MQYFDFNDGNNEFSEVSLETFQASSNATAIIETASDGQISFKLNMTTLDTDAIEAAMVIFTNYILTLG
tara:strand:+ start:69661 stop:69867 length:207 start_codon:yes stop_codon:yes gene_type:complete